MKVGDRMNKENAANDLIDLLTDQVLERLVPLMIERFPALVNNEPNRSLSVEEAAEFLGISKDLLYKLCAEKSIPHTKLGVVNSKKPRMIFSSHSLETWRRQQEEINCIGWNAKGDTR